MAPVHGSGQEARSGSGGTAPLLRRQFCEVNGLSLLSQVGNAAVKFREMRVRVPPQPTTTKPGTVNIQPITPKAPACFGLCCELHNQCARYHAIEGMPDSSIAIDSCSGMGEGPRPLFQPEVAIAEAAQ